MNNELYHSDIYLGEDYTDGIKHWKYISKERVNGKWRYYYNKKDDRGNDSYVNSLTDPKNKYEKGTTNRDIVENTNQVLSKTIKKNNSTYKYQGVLERGAKSVQNTVKKSGNTLLSSAKSLINKGKTLLDKLWDKIYNPTHSSKSVFMTKFKIEK